MTGIGNNYINIEGIYCFYFIDLLIDVDIEIINSITINDYVTVMGLVTNPSVDAFRLSYCTVTERIPAEERQPDEVQDHPEPSGPSDVSDTLRQVLLREKQFTNETGEQVYCDVISNELDTYETGSFAIIDMNGDGTKEVVICSYGQVDCVYTVLYEYNGTVYGKEIGGGRSVKYLQTNGLFLGSSGASIGYVQSCEINGAQCEVILETYMDEEYSAYGFGTDKYEIREQAATKEEYENYLNQIGWETDDSMEAEFYDYTTENILALLTE